MHVKISYRPVDKSALSEHEVKRCAVATGQHWNGPALAPARDTCNAHRRHYLNVTM